MRPLLTIPRLTLLPALWHMIERLMSRLNLGVNLAAARCLQMGPVVVTAVKRVRAAQNSLSTISVSQLIVTF